MYRAASCVLVSFTLFSSSILLSSRALAEPAQVSIGRVDGDRYASPPPEVAARAAPVERASEPPSAPPERARYQSAFRVSGGPSMIVAGTHTPHAYLGALAAADFGTGPVGLRIAGAWLRSELGDPNTPGAALGLTQYTGEITLDLDAHSAWHPIAAVGAGYAHWSAPTGTSDTGIGLARLGLEYAVDADEVDVRIGASILGAIAGSSDRAVPTPATYAIATASLGIGF